MDWHFSRFNLAGSRREPVFARLQTGRQHGVYLLQTAFIRRGNIDGRQVRSIEAKRYIRPGDSIRQTGYPGRHTAFDADPDTIRFERFAVSDADDLHDV